MRGATRFLVGTLVGAAVGYVLIMLVSQRPTTRRPIIFAGAPETPDAPLTPEPELAEVAA